MILGHDHTIYLVADPGDFDGVCEAFRDLGFILTEREDEGRDQASTMQKLVCFADGTYIEILTVRGVEARARHRFAHFLAAGNGWADYSLHADNLVAVRERLVAAALPFAGPHSHARRLSDGRPWGVSLILPGIGAGHPALPFVLEDTAGRELRIPSHSVRHANGVTGTGGVTVAARDPGAVADRLTRLCGPDALVGHFREGEAERVRIRLRSGWIDLVESALQASPGQAIAGGEGIVAVTLVRPGTIGHRPLPEAGAATLPGLFVTGSQTAAPI